MNKEEHFKTPIWWEEKLDFIRSLNKASDKHIKEARKRNKLFIKETGDFGMSHHSTQLLSDNSFLDFRNYIGKKSWEYLDDHGYDMKQYDLIFSEMWVQEFSKKGGGHHSAHIHWNQHVNFVARPGVLIIFPGYLEHEFTVDHGKEPFRFIHWNMTAIPKGILKND